MSDQSDLVNEHAPAGRPRVRATASAGWDNSGRAGTIGVLLIFLLPLALLVIGWAMRGLPDLPTPKQRPGRLPDAHWAARPALPAPRADAGLAALGGKLYVFGGTAASGAARLGTSEIFDPAAGRWVTGPTLTTPRTGTRAAALGDSLYLVGGITDAEPGGSALVEVLDTRTGGWRRLAPLPTPRAGHSLVALNGRLYALGGASGGAALGTVETYDSATDRWSALAALPTPRADLATAVLDGKIYALGGTVNGEPSAIVEIYDPATNAWTAGPAMPVPMEHFGAALLDGRIHALEYQVHQVFDPAAGKWLGATEMPTVRQGQGVISVGDTLYTIGGRAPETSVILAAVEAYEPGPAPAVPVAATGRDRGGSLAVILGALVTLAIIPLVLYLSRNRPSDARDEPLPESEEESEV